MPRLRYSRRRGRWIVTLILLLLAALMAYRVIRAAAGEGAPASSRPPLSWPSGPGHSVDQVEIRHECVSAIAYARPGHRPAVTRYNRSSSTVAGAAKWDHSFPCSQPAC
jgi:hypothetical protein